MAPSPRVGRRTHKRLRPPWPVQWPRDGSAALWMGLSCPRRCRCWRRAPGAPPSSGQRGRAAAMSSPLAPSLASMATRQIGERAHTRIRSYEGRNASAWASRGWAYTARWAAARQRISCARSQGCWPRLNGPRWSNALVAGHDMRPARGWCMGSAGHLMVIATATRRRVAARPARRLARTKPGESAQGVPGWGASGGAWARGAGASPKRGK